MKSNHSRSQNEIDGTKTRVRPIRFSLSLSPSDPGGRGYFFYLLLGGHGSSLGSNPLLVLQSVLTVNCIRFSLCGVLNVGLVEKVLNTQQDLFDGNGGLPIFLFIQQRQTHRA
uniref:Uncharacterized protein n=1 Tax=Cacopsylla melanoneura TaxID=428564 RepID=A0A8D8U346_9HEMI